MTSREGASTAVSGFRVFGSARNETTSRPPRCPISPGRVNSSSEELDCGGNPLAGRAKTAAPAKSKPQPTHLPIVEDLAILTICSRHSPSQSSLCLRPAATHPRAPSILERMARLPARARTSTSTIPRRCIAEGLQGGYPSLALARARRGPERKASSPRARTAARGSLLASELHWKFPARCGASGDNHRLRRSPAPPGRNHALLCSAPLHVPAVLAAPTPPLR